MFNRFNVTELGIQLNGKMLMPGSSLLIKGEPHKSWLPCGHVAGQVTERTLVVASPAEPVESAVPAAPADLETIRRQYELTLGKKPHHKMTEQTMLAAIESGAAQ